MVQFIDCDLCCVGVVTASKTVDKKYALSTDAVIKFIDNAVTWVPSILICLSRL